MIRRPHFADLAESIVWLKETWTAREIPNRLHDRETGDDGAPRFSPAFARHLDAQPHDVTLVTTTRTCSHPRMARNASTWECPDCLGTSVFDSTVHAFRYPMWLALTKLNKDAPRAHEIVLTFVINAFDVGDVLTLMGIREGRLLDAIRSLYSRYQLAPEGRRLAFTSKSESQRLAEDSAPLPLQVGMVAA